MLLILSTSSLMAFSSSNWLMIWMSMEINTLTMCYLLSKENKKNNKENKTTLLYLIVQILASLVMIFPMTMKSSMVLKIIVIFSMFMKMGLWPIHLWFVKILDKTSMKFKSFLVMMTWQKLIPLMVLSMLCLSEEEKSWMIMLTLMSVLSPLTNLKESSSLKTVMIISSINMSGWMMLSMMSSLKIMTFLFTIYSVSIYLTLKEFKELMKNDKMIKKNKESIMMMSNMGGLPPLSMFWVKIMVLKEMMKIMSNLMTMTLMVSASIFLYNYMMAVMNQMIEMKENKKNMNFSMVLIFFMSLSSMILCFIVLDYT